MQGANPKSVCFCHKFPRNMSTGTGTNTSSSMGLYKGVISDSNQINLSLSSHSHASSVAMGSDGQPARIMRELLRVAYLISSVTS